MCVNGRKNTDFILIFYVQASEEHRKTMENVIFTSDFDKKRGMKVHHIALWTFRLEELRTFYVRYFGGRSNEKYVNPRKGFESYFITFEGGVALELMSRPDVTDETPRRKPAGTDTSCVFFYKRGRCVAHNRAVAQRWLSGGGRAAHVGRRIF